MELKFGIQDILFKKWYTPVLPLQNKMKKEKHIYSNSTKFKMI